MKKIKYIFIYLLFVFSNLIFAQSGWYPLSSGTTTYLNKIQFVNSQTGWAGGHQGIPTYYILIKTTNGGDTWIDQRPNFPYGNRIISLFFLNANTGWITGADGLFKTTNGGNNFIALNGNCVNDCYFVDNLTGWILCVPVAPQLMKTTDGGTTFNSQYINIGSSEQLSSIRFINTSTGWCVGNNYIFKTTNGGTNWTSQTHPYCTGIKCVYTLSSEIAWITADSGKVLSTTNGGIEWISKSIGSNYSVSSVYFVNPSTGYISTYPRNIFKTVNNGINWYPQMTDTSSIINSIYFTSNDTGFACGSMGKIFKTTNGGGTIGIKKINEIIPNKYSLSQNYPNPFNSSSKFNIGITKQSNVRVLVFDALGRKIETIVNEELNPGTYEVLFDATNYPSGIYFYKIIIGDYKETKRMTLIK